MAKLRLYLLRHAKSSRDQPVADFDRTLASKGRKSMAHVAALVEREGYMPALVLCSTALRARETFAELLPHLPADAAVTFTRRIYEEGAEGILALIGEAGDDAPSVMVVGHNPALEELAQTLSSQGDREAKARLRVKFPPAALAVIDFEDATWPHIRHGNGELVAYHTPDED